MFSSNRSNLIQYKNYFLGLNRMHFIHGNWIIMHTIWQYWMHICWLTTKVKFDVVALLGSSRQKILSYITFVKFRKKKKLQHIMYLLLHCSSSCFASCKKKLCIKLRNLGYHMKIFIKKRSLALLTTKNIYFGMDFTKKMVRIFRLM